MKILIAADMEGVTGVVHWDQVDPDHKTYPRFQKLMTGDVNAAIRGAYDGGATSVTVVDGHNAGRNLLIEEMDPRAWLSAGSPAPLGMVQGLEAGVAAAMFVGYHARSGSANAILDHTWSSSSVAGVWLNGQATGEIGWNAAVCGDFDVPVILISGDQTASTEATGLLGAIETATVKKACGRMAAECLAPAASQALIYEAAVRAVQRLAEGDAPQPLHLERPITLRVELVTSDMADRAQIVPGTRRVDGRVIEYVAVDAVEAYRAFRTLAAVAKP
jgi:D-amino peptidase